MATIAPPVSRATNGFLLFGIAAAAVLAAYSFVVIRSLPVHHDIAWPLHVAGQVRAGAAPYVDIIEVHPPLILWFALASRQLADLFGISPIAGYHTLTLMVGLLSLVASAAALRLLARDAVTESLLLLAVAAVLFPFVGYSFGQEEHLMLCLTLPYLFITAARVRQAVPGRLALGIGVMAGIGLAMKPLYGAAWLGAELTLALAAGWRRLVRTESVACAAVLILYPIAVLLLTPAYLRVASWAGQVYFAFHPTPFPLILLSGGTLAVLTALLLHSRARDDASAPLRRTLAAFVIGCALIVFGQGKGWSYHWYPAIATALLLMHVAAPGVAHRMSSRDVVARAAAAATALMIVLLGFAELRRDAAAYATLASAPYHLPEMRAVVERHAPGGSIMALSTTMQIGFPLVNYTGVSWSSRFATLWPLPGLYADVSAAQPYPYRAPETMTGLERYMFEAVLDDMARNRPRLLILDRYPPSASMSGFQYLEYFGRDPRFREMFSQYRPIAQVSRYIVFVRQDADRPTEQADGDRAGATE